MGFRTLIKVQCSSMHNGDIVSEADSGIPHKIKTKIGLINRLGILDNIRIEGESSMLCLLLTHTVCLFCIRVHSAGKLN